MNRKRIFALAFAVLMVLSLAACGTRDNDKQADMSGNGSAMTGEPKNAEEALALHKELLERENAILSENTALWEKVFMEADKGMAMVEDGKNYGDFLLDTIEAAKEQFTDKEYAWLKESATEISNIENKLTELEEKYPEIMQKSMDGDMSVPGGSDMTTPPDDGSMQKFPAFEGKDLDGNTVKSDELFSGNAVTVVNFWFTTCNPCVGELAELDALNKELAEKGGALIGVNAFTLDGDEAAISEAKAVLDRRAPPIRMCILTPMARPEPSPPTSLPIPPPMWSTAMAISWASPSSAPSRKRSRRKRCKRSLIRSLPPIWADPRLKKRLLRAVAVPPAGKGRSEPRFP